MKLRKALSIFLAICMVLSSVSVAYAGEVQVNDTEIVAVEEIEVDDEKIEQATVSEESVTEEETPEASPSEDDEIEVVKADIVLEATAKDGMKVTLKADEDAFEHSEGLTLIAETVDEEVAEEASEDLEDETKNDNVAKRVTYDIKVMHDSEEIQPVEGKKVTVEFTMTDVPSGADAVNVYHHVEEGEKTVIDTIVDEAPVNEDNAESVSDDNAVVVSEDGSTAKSVNNTETSDEVDEEDIPEDADIVDDVTVSGETDGFSLYTVDFTYEEKTVSIAGDTKHNKLSDILAKLDITEAIEDVKAYQDAECTEAAENNEVKNADGDVLYRVYELNGIWYADAVNSFQTEHGLVVKTKDDAEYKIKVTDAGGETTELHFLDWDDTQKKLVDAFIGTGTGTKATTYTVINSSSTPSELTAGWYVVDGTVDYGTGGITVSGDVHLILKDSCNLAVTGGDNKAGIYVPWNGSLTIYGQSSGTGTLNSTGGNYGAGIGGGDSASGSNITINGGKVTATGNGGGAGIGGGCDGSAENITINGGEVTAKGYDGGAGIGCGDDHAAINITINGGIIKAIGIGNNCGDGIGSGGGCNPSKYIKVSTSFIVKAGANADKATEITNNGSDLANDLYDKKYVEIYKKPTPEPTPKSSGSSGSSSYTTGWHQSGTNWQYVKSDGSFAKNEWVQIEVNGVKQWYHFGNDTNMDTGWLRDTDGSWYYLSKEEGQNIGIMQTGWMTDPQDGHRYYLDPKTGKMATGWTEIDGKMYYFSEGAATESGWSQNESSDWVYSKRDSIPLGALIQ